jgi:ribonuclease HI
MPRKRKKKAARTIHLSLGPLPLRIAGQFAGQLLVFSDASQNKHGGLAAVLFDTPDQPAVVATQTVPRVGSNELELQAALFGLARAQQHFPGRQCTLFSDNQDAANRLSRAKTHGLAQDPELAGMLAEWEITSTLAIADIRWIKGHSSCRGNALADQHAAEAAR